MVNKNFGQLLRNFRNINQLTQQQVADVLNIHRTTYTYYENGITEPSIDTLHKLIKILGISYDDILPSHKNYLTVSELYFKSDNTLFNLTQAEQNVVLYFRTLSDKDKVQFLNILQNQNKEK